jgi:hypothetical protein
MAPSDDGGYEAVADRPVMDSTLGLQTEEPLHDAPSLESSPVKTTTSLP